MSTTEKVQHTPAPWKIRDDLHLSPGDGLAIISEAADGMTMTIIADICPCDDPFSGPSAYEPISLTNARLIAAAPDLLAALKALVAEIEGVDRAHPSEFWRGSEYMDARRAILLAEGRTP